uniref:Uncharacterized protein n=1 Tax=Cacopsylla melanoneura TaxID=428564 RepID=A0A8D8M2C1_9HEMI
MSVPVQKVYYARKNCLHFSEHSRPYCQFPYRKSTMLRQIVYFFQNIVDFIARFPHSYRTYSLVAVPRLQTVYCVQNIVYCFQNIVDLIVSSRTESPLCSDKLYTFFRT